MGTFNFKVGDKICLKGWDTDRYRTITALGKKGFLALHPDSMDEVHHSYEGCRWLPYTPPKKTVRMAPALTKALIPFGEARAWSDGGKQLTGMYENENTAKLACGDGFIKWPASENLWVDVPVEE